MDLHKLNIRKQALKSRNSLNTSELRDLSNKISALLLKFNLSRKNISCFLPIKENKEVDTIDLINKLCETNKIYVPVTDFINLDIHHIRYIPGDALKLNNYKIPEPVNQKDQVDSFQLDVFIIPLLASDIKGNRIGYGKGFYDRMLLSSNPNSLKIGLSFFEPFDSIPSEPHDIPLTHLITPNRIFEF